MANDSIDLAEIRARLAAARGKQYWRSLEELADTPAFNEFLQREFPRGASELNAGMSRRGFLKVMGASLALAGLGGCSVSPPREKIVPYVQQPDPAITPGKPLFFATAMPFGGYGLGLLAESHIGRPTKIEGNPAHPATLGTADVFAQASVLSLYDPDRAQAVTNRGQPSTWETFLSALSDQLAAVQGSQGAGLRILTETITSPTLASQIQALLQKLPQARWHQYDPIGNDGAFEGARQAFGQYVNTIYDFTKADRVLALDANFMHELPGHLRYAHDFIGRRQASQAQPNMNRLYVVESTPTITGAMADHRLPLRASQIEPFARALAQALGMQAGGAAAPPGVPAGWIEALARDLQSRRGASIVIAGPEQPAAVHALAHAMNQALGNVGTTVRYTQPVEASPANHAQSLRDLAADIAAGRVTALISIDANPAYSAPADLNFADLLRKVPFVAHTSLYFDETAALAHWHVPATHYLETWSDVRAFDGTATIIQPLILPLYNGRSPHELLAALNGAAGQSSYDVVRAYWQGQRQGSNFEQFWRQSVHDGVVAGTAAAPAQVTLAGAALTQASPAPAGAGGLEISFRPDPSIWDGRFANNAWLQELPKQLTTITWDNAAYVSPATAQARGLQTGDLVELRVGGRVLRAPIWIMGGQPDDSITISLGYGRERAGQVGNGVGTNAYALRSSDAPWFAGGLEIAATGERYAISATQEHFSVEGRDLVREGTLAQFQQNPKFVQNEFDQFLPVGRPQQPEAAAGGQESKEENQGGEEHNVPSLYPEYRYTGYAWGMAINLNSCIGCNACTIACQAENNIPVVGKEQVGHSREMHWLKVDVYNSGELDNPDTIFQPRPCMHCEKAPCEVVCPVAATLHDAEGLNNMVYNRCVGTRYCSNNCPYKVRRFNFLAYNEDIPVINLVRNPDVTVRARGVMEKCTYCVQRIEEARITAERETRTIRDGEILTACQQTCPTNAIVFGNINDPNSQVSQLKGQPLHFGMLAELGTQPRTTYLARLRNPNPEMPGARS
jgi:molybdopterin-containing oxidoreductase family iron-sulfur binding subunit